MLVEHGFALKQVFTTIGQGIRKKSAEASQDTVYASAVLHNIRIDFQKQKNPAFNLPTSMRRFPDFNFDEKMSQSFVANPYDLQDKNSVRDRVISLFFTPQ